MGPKDLPTTEDAQETTQSSAEKSTDAQEGTGQEATFTQAQLDKVLSERLARERAKMPNSDELKAFGEWKKAQQTEAEKAEAREQDLAKARAEAESLKRENAVIRAGVKAEDADYVLFKVGKMEGDFAENLASFIAENEKFTQPETTQVAGTRHSQSKTDPLAGFEAAMRQGAGLK